MRAFILQPLTPATIPLGASQTITICLGRYSYTSWARSCLPSRARPPQASTPLPKCKGQPTSHQTQSTERRDRAKEAKALGIES